MSIYLDELFIINFVSCFFMLYVYAELIHFQKKLLRLLLASTIGAASACLIFVSGLNMLVFIVADTLLVLTAYGRIGVIRILVFILIKYVFSGISVFILSSLGGGAAIIRSGIIYFDISSVIFTVVFIITYMAVILLVRLVKTIRNRKFYTVIMYNNEKSAVLKALYDSGNLLSNPYDSTAVIIAEKSSVKNVISGNPVLIPFRSLGTDSGMIMAYKIDRVYLVESGKTINDITIGISEQALSKNGEIQALIGPGII